MGWEVAQWQRMLSLYLWCHCPSWTSVPVLAAPFLILLPVDGLEKHQRMSQVLGPLYSHGRSRSILQHPPLDQLNSCHCGHWGSDPAIRRPSLDVFVLLYRIWLSNKINKSFKTHSYSYNIQR